jgi:hypothetical protein
MKKVMSTFLVLTLTDFTQPFVLECDSFGEGIGWLLMQNRHMIAFERKKLRELESLYSIYYKEMLIIFHALAKFRKYLVGGHFVVRNDHNILRYLLEQRDLNERKHKWVSKVKAYGFNIEYVNGKKNIVFDTLSRRHVSFSMT